MKTAPPKTQIWIRKNEELLQAIDDSAKAAGMKQVDFVTKVMEHAVSQQESDPYFFLSRGDCDRQRSKRKTT